MEQGDSREGRAVVLALTTTKTHLCRTLDSPRSQYILQQLKTPSCIRHNAPSWEAAWMAVAKTGMVALTLQGQQSSLFKKHLSFTNASKNMGAPTMSPTFQLQSVTENFQLMKLKKSWDHRAATIIEGLFLLEYGDDELAHEKKIGAPYVNNLINKFPVHSFMELEIEYMSKKHVVGGAIDLAVGVAGNGDKPRVKIQGVGSSMHLFFGCLGEAKGADVQLATTKDTGFVSDLADIKAIIQPALEVMTISEVATFPKSDVPLVNVLASKLAFRPVFYWRDLDVILTTPKVIPLRASQNKVDIRGLLFLFTIVQVHRKSCIKFDVEKLRTLPKTGWAEALKDGVHNSGDSVIKLGTPRCDFPHSSADYFTAQSDSSDSSNDDSATETRKIHLSPISIKKPKKIKLIT